MLFWCTVSYGTACFSRSSYNQLLNEDSLSDTGTSEETNLSSTSVGGQQIDDLDTSDEHLGGGGLLNELRGVGVDGSHLGGLDGTALIDGVTSDVHDATESSATDGNHDGGTSVDGLGASDETLGTCLEISSVPSTSSFRANSLPSMAIHLTMFSPKCWATSSVSLLPLWMISAYGPRTTRVPKNLPIVGCQSVENGRELIVVELDCGARSAPILESR
jgi:hypothetical protein